MYSSALLKATVVSNFSKGSRWPLRQAITKLLQAYVIAITLGVIFSRALEKLDLPLGLPIDLAITLAMLLGFVLSGLTLISVQASEIGISKDHGLQRILRLMPLTQGARWLTDIIPSIIILGMLSCFGGPILYTVANIMQLPIVIVELAWVAGLASGLGLVKATLFKSLFARGAAFVVIVSLVLWTIEQSLSGNEQSIQNLGPKICLALLALPIIGLRQSYVHGYSLNIKLLNSEKSQVLSRHVPLKMWLIVKLFRNRRSRNSFILALGMNSLISLVLIYKHLLINDPEGMLIIGGILAATFSCDIRGIIRRFLPPEIVQLKGLKSFVASEILSTWSLGSVIGLPLFFTLNRFANGSVWFGLYYILIQLFCCSCGLFASTLIVPADGEVGSQFFTAVVSLVLIAAFIKYGHLADLDIWKECIGWLAASVMVFVCILTIEIIRRKTYGRS